VRAASGSDQKPASACRDSSAFSRSAFAVRSKKVSQLGDPVLQVGQALGQVGHVVVSTP
jgi:hypothetical protein